MIRTRSHAVFDKTIMDDAPLLSDQLTGCIRRVPSYNTMNGITFLGPEYFAHIKKVYFKRIIANNVYKLSIFGDDGEEFAVVTKEYSRGAAFVPDSIRPFNLKIENKDGEVIFRASKATSWSNPSLHVYLANGNVPLGYCKGKLYDDNMEILNTKHLKISTVSPGEQGARWDVKEAGFGKDGKPRADTGKLFRRKPDDVIHEHVWEIKFPEDYEAIEKVLLLHASLFVEILVSKSLD